MIYIKTPKLSLRGRPKPIGIESEFCSVLVYNFGHFRRKVVCKVIIFCQILKPLSKIYFYRPQSKSPVG